MRRLNSARASDALRGAPIRGKDEEEDEDAEEGEEDEDDDVCESE